MHIETDPLDTERLDLRRTAKPNGFYADRVVDKVCYIKISLEMLEHFDDEAEIHKALEFYLDKKSV